MKTLARSKEQHRYQWFQICLKAVRRRKNSVHESNNLWVASIMLKPTQIAHEIKITNHMLLVSIPRDSTSQRCFFSQSLTSSLSRLSPRWQLWHQCNHLMVVIWIFFLTLSFRRVEGGVWQGTVAIGSTCEEKGRANEKAPCWLWVSKVSNVYPHRKPLQMDGCTLVLCQRGYFILLNNSR